MLRRYGMALSHHSVKGRTPKRATWVPFACVEFILSGDRQEGALRDDRILGFTIEC